MSLTIYNNSAKINIYREFCECLSFTDKTIYYTICLRSIYKTDNSYRFPFANFTGNPLWERYVVIYFLVNLYYWSSLPTNCISWPIWFAMSLRERYKPIVLYVVSSMKNYTFKEMFSLNFIVFIFLCTLLHLPPFIRKETALLIFNLRIIWSLCVIYVCEDVII
jgi:hypothetical protein